MLEKFKALFLGATQRQGDALEPESVRVQAASLPDPPPLKATQRARLTLPSFLGSAPASSRSAIPRSDRRLVNADITQYRNTSRDSREAVRNFVAASPDLSSAVFSYLRLAITRSYTAVARDMDGTLNPEGTTLLHEMLSRFDNVGAYDDGFSTNQSQRSCSEQLGRELLLYGACAMELVLDKARLPSRLQPVSVVGIEFYPDGSNGVRPVQKVGTNEVDLDVPTFVYISLDQDLLEVYATSPLEPALQPTLFAQEFLNDIRRIVKRVIHPRIRVKIDEAKFRTNIPQDIQADEEKLAAYMAEFIGEIETKINNLAPEDALVYFDTIGIDLESRGNDSLSGEYEVLQNLIDGKMATGAKSMPAVLGHGSASSNIASTETMLQLRNAEGAIQGKLNEVYSRILTVALRLMGLNVYVEFEYESVNLRPEQELEAFKQTHQARVLELLSLGLLSDEEASIRLTGHLPPKGYKNLSGTFFKSAQAPGDPNPNGESNNGSTLNQNLNPDTPSQGRGQNRRASPVRAESNVTFIS